MRGRAAVWAAGALLVAAGGGRAGAAQADDLEVTAHADKTEVAPGDRLVFSVTIAGPIRQNPKVDLPGFDGFRPVSTGQSQQIRVEKGRLMRSVTLTYALAAVEPGTQTLGPVKVTCSGRVYQTQPIEVQVLAGSDPRQRRERPKLEGGTIL